MKKNLLQVLRGNKSQSEIASSYGVSQQAWRSWESGRTVPNNEIMLKMEKEFPIPMEVIFFDSFNYKNELNNEKSA
ncbi:helix-turn-helix transcriptional regulator [Pectinatus frisingensis]|uniref:helix-turn-helix transcriptional regulator n=1 Tax=Pectinatus frisingensis TaxID=865 RepID=UPI0018C852E2|nr:helix-turn-helix domain-containing protein [Pectinatus frisingensis]